MEIIKRSAAKKLGLKRYFTGKSCKMGHVAQRKVVNGACCECALLGTKEWRTENADHIAEYNKDYKKVYRVESKDKLRELKSKYYHENRERLAPKYREYVQNNREKVYANSHNRRAKYRLIEGKFTAEDIKRLEKIQNNKCAECRNVLVKRHIDHIMPLALGGTNWPNNLQLLCPSCNCRKSSKHPLDWAKQNGRLL